MRRRRAHGAVAAVARAGATRGEAIARRDAGVAAGDSWIASSVAAPQGPAAHDGIGRGAPGRRHRPQARPRGDSTLARRDSLRRQRDRRSVNREAAPGRNPPPCAGSTLLILPQVPRAAGGSVRGSLRQRHEGPVRSPSRRAAGRSAPGTAAAGRSRGPSTAAAGRSRGPRTAAAGRSRGSSTAASRSPRLLYRRCRRPSDRRSPRVRPAGHTRALGTHLATASHRNASVVQVSRQRNPGERSGMRARRLSPPGPSRHCCRGAAWSQSDRAIGGRGACADRARPGARSRRRGRCGCGRCSRRPRSARGGRRAPG